MQYKEIIFKKNGNSYLNNLLIKYKIIRIRSPTQKELLDVNLRFFILYSFCTIKKRTIPPYPIEIYEKK